MVSQQGVETPEEVWIITALCFQKAIESGLGSSKSLHFSKNAGLEWNYLYINL